MKDFLLHKIVKPVLAILVGLLFSLVVYVLQSAYEGMYDELYKALIFSAVILAGGFTYDAMKSIFMLSEFSFEELLSRVIKMLVGLVLVSVFIFLTDSYGDFEIKGYSIGPILAFGTFGWFLNFLWQTISAVKTVVDD